jgi:glycosyltransferase involved in cell wall biosynthesis
MANQLECIMRQATRSDDEPLNILCFPTHERAESVLAKTGHRFWAFRAQGIKEWKRHYAPVPENYHLLNPAKGQNQLPRWIDFDLVLIQNKVGQFQIGKQIADQLRIPTICIEHTLPPPDYVEGQIKRIRDMQADVNVFVSEYQREAWNFNEDFGIIVHTGIDTNQFKPLNLEREKTCLCVVNDWINRDWCCGFSVFKKISGYPNLQLPIKILGDTPGLSKPAKDVPELVQAYNTSWLYLNTTTISSLPTTIIEAMSCGCPIVSTNTCLIPKILVDHEINGFCSDKPSDLRNYCRTLLNDKELSEQMGQAARKKVVEHFSIEKYIKKWQEIFKLAIEIRK